MSELAARVAQIEEELRVLKIDHEMAMDALEEIAEARAHGHKRVMDCEEIAQGALDVIACSQPIAA